MKLYYSPTSPYVRKVLIAATELGIIDRIEKVSVHVTPIEPSEQLNRENPLGKIPALVTDDGLVLYDSRVICAYLDDLHREVKLVPPSGTERWHALRREALADGMLEAAVLLRYEGLLRPEEKRWSAWSEGQRSKIVRGLDAAEAEADALGGAVTLGTIALACALGYLDLRYPEMAWRDQRAGLHHFMDGFASRESYRSTAPPS